MEADEILRVLKEHRGRALHVMEICGRLGVGTWERDAVRDELERLEEQGLVQQLPGLRFKAARGARARPSSAPRIRSTPSRAAPTAHLGNLTIHARGFGFVSREDGGEDVFIPAGELAGAIHGDRVAVSVRPSEKGLEGSVVAVVERRLRRVAGVLRKERRAIWIETGDSRVRRDVHVRGKLPADAVPGVEVVAEVLHIPDEGPIEAKVSEVLGAAGSAEVEVAKIKLREGVEEEHDEATLEEARAFGNRLRPSDRKGREDLRHLELVTIDPATARDHDDAVFVEKKRGGGFRAVIAIADVSHYVQPGTALDHAALERGCTIYLPDRSIPMLPQELAAHLASLVAGRDRLTMAVEVTLSATGAVQSHRYIEGVMRCKAALTYEGVASALGWSDETRRERAAESRLGMLKVLSQLADLLRAKRMRRGSLDFDLPEPFVSVDPDTNEPLDVQRAKRDPGVRKAYQLVEEMMLLANEVVAADLHKRRTPAIYRVHGPPEEEKLEQFANLAQALGARIDPEDASNPRRLSKFLRALEDSPHSASLSYLLLRAMQQATYETESIGHFGLAAKHYLHFTSPIRRYPDLAVHRVVRALARGERVRDPQLESRMAEQAAHASERERRAMTVEREVVDVYRCILVKDRIGEEFEATVSGVAPHGIYCAFDDPYVEAFCHVSVLGNDFYEADQHGLRLVGRRSGASYGLGDRMTVRLESVNVSERAVLAAPVVYMRPEDVHGMAELELDPVHEGGGRRLRRLRKEQRQERPEPEERKRTPRKRREDAPRKRRDDSKKQRRKERRGQDERKSRKRNKR